MQPNMRFACIYNLDFTLMSADYFSHFMWLSSREHISVCLRKEVPFFVFFVLFFLKLGSFFSHCWFFKEEKRFIFVMSTLIFTFLHADRPQNVYFLAPDSYLQCVLSQFTEPVKTQTDTNHR